MTSNRAEMQKSHYIVLLLQFLRQKGPANLHMIATELHHIKSGSVDRHNMGMHHTRNTPGKIAKHIAPVLQELAHLGVIKENQENTYSLSAPPPIPPDPPGPSDADGPGSGLGEILAHPILFSYSTTDFEDALQRALRNFNG